jgi:hypothetical protein
VTQIPVNHRPRQYGKSKYGLKRTVKVALDLVVVKFIQAISRSQSMSSWIRPFQFSSVFAYIRGNDLFQIFRREEFYSDSIAASGDIIPANRRHLHFYGTSGQINMMTYYESQGRKSYQIAYTRNLEHLS